MDGESIEKMTLVDGLIVIGIFIAFGYGIIMKLNEKENRSWIRMSSGIKSWWNGKKDKLNPFSNTETSAQEIWGDTTQIM